DPLSRPTGRCRPLQPISTPRRPTSLSSLPRRATIRTRPVHRATRCTQVHPRAVSIPPRRPSTDARSCRSSIITRITLITPKYCQV
ncbi:hypothetical protein IWQ60_006932, partial [Tieghemiomyces parasiticus]